jgi:uncharacterized LabA/DUF88 family protein
MSLDTACIFVDGENLRHSLVDLFPTEFDPFDYLPKNADWSGFFAQLVRESGAKTLLRAYWYVVEEIDFFPHGNWTKTPQMRHTVLCKHEPFENELRGLSEPAKSKKAYELAGYILREEKKMTNKFLGWKNVQDGISKRTDLVEFRRAGSIRYNLFQKRLHNEKAVDVYLATDLLQLRDIYDIAIIVSGDQDYVPAVQAIKNSGKHVVNVSFKERGGGLLPGGARRLNLKTDKNLEIEFSDVLRFMRLGRPPQPSNQPKLFSK